MKKIILILLSLIILDNSIIKCAQAQVLSSRNITKIINLKDSDSRLLDCLIKSQSSFKAIIEKLLFEARNMMQGTIRIQAELSKLKLVTLADFKKLHEEFSINLEEIKICTNNFLNTVFQDMKKEYPEEHFNEFLNLITNLLIDYLEYTYKPRLDFIEKTLESKLKICECDNVSVANRLFHIIVSVLGFCDRLNLDEINLENKVVFTSLASGELLQEYLIAKQLLSIGFTNIEINLIDPINALLIHKIQNLQILLSCKGENNIKINTFNEFKEYLAQVNEQTDSKDYLQDNDIKSNILILVDPPNLSRYIPRECNTPAKLQEYLTANPKTTFAESKLGLAFQELQINAVKLNGICITLISDKKGIGIY